MTQGSRTFFSFTIFGYAFGCPVLLFSFLFCFNSCTVLRPTSQAEAVMGTDSVVNALFMKATQDMMLEDQQSAFVNFEKVLRLQPRNATAHYQLSRLWLNRNNLPEAIKEIESAFKYAPDNKWVINQYAMLMGMNGEYEKAAALYGQLAQMEQQPEEYMIKQAFSYEKAGKDEKALAILDQLKKFVGEDNEEVLLQRQKLFLNLNQVDKAIAESSLLVKYYPRKPEYLLLLANVYAKYKDKEKGLALFKEADREFPNNIQVQAALLRYYLANDRDAVGPYLDDVILKRGAPLEDKINILGILKMAPKVDSGKRNLTRHYVYELTQRQPPDPQAVLFYGMILNAEGEPDSAAIAFKRAILLDSTNFMSWQQLFLVEAGRDKLDSLIISTESARPLFPKDPMINYFNGYGYLKKKEYAKAIPVFLDGLDKLAPEDTSLLVQFHSFLGDAYQEEKDYEQAAHHYETALGLAPRNLTVLNNYSYFLARQGIRLEEAEQMSAQTIKLHPEEATFLDTYGWILFKQGKFKEAKKYLEKALANMAETDDKSTTLEHLGDVEYKLGHTESALQRWKLAQKAGGGSEELYLKIKTQKLNQ
jgi:tetratricopeptide (TPR) repeat protein